MKTFTRPELSKRGQDLVSESIANFKKRPVTFQMYLIGKMMLAFRKLVNDVNGYRLNRGFNLLAQDSEFSDQCNAIQNTVNANQLETAARLIFTENMRLTEESNYHRQSLGVGAKLERKKAVEA